MIITDPLGDAARVAVIVVAAGSGTRLGASVPKAFVRIGDRTMLRRAIDGVVRAVPAQIIVVAPAGWEAPARVDAADATHDVVDATHDVVVVTGGASRQQSVAAGLAALRADVEIVLVHDAARALVPRDVFTRVIDAVAAGSAAIPALPVIDTLKQVDGAVVLDHVDRSVLVAAQTPQGFRRDHLVAAYASADEDHTDDAALMQAAGHEVVTVAGDALSFKITTPADLRRATSLVAAPEPRVGVGTDVHAFADGGTLWLAGLEWPGERALAGHSDGDAVAHAIVDALLSAAGLGDIGGLFGTDDPAVAGAHADLFLARTATRVRDAGWRIANVAVQVQAARPRFADRRAEAERTLTAALGAPVSVSATTTDGLGFVGAIEGVQAFAVAQLVPATAA